MDQTKNTDLRNRLRRNNYDVYRSPSARSTPARRLSDVRPVFSVGSRKVDQDFSHSVISAQKLLVVPHAQKPLQKQPVQKTASYAVKPDSSSSLPIIAVKQSVASDKDILADQFDGRAVHRTKITKTKGHRLQKVFYIVGSFIFLFSLFAAGQTMLHNKEAKETLEVLGDSTDTQQPEADSSAGSEENPSEVVPSSESVRSYQVADPTAPRYISIPELKVRSRVKPMNRTKEGAVAAPGNVHDAGWFKESAKPGQSGASLIVGHVSGWTSAGVFKKLHTLHEGSRFEVELGNGEKVSYEVTKLERYSADNVPMGTILTTEAGDHDIKLMTCGGKYDSKNDEYTERIVVFAKHMK